LRKVAGLDTDHIDVLILSVGLILRAKSAKSEVPLDDWKNYRVRDLLSFSFESFCPLLLH
jgi:hypothetical protein